MAEPTVELAKCPNCGEETLLVNAIAMAQVPARGVIAPWWGNPAFGYLVEGAAVTCNRNACRWTGTLADVLADDTASTGG